MNARLNPTLALTLGDPPGIGPELIAKLMARGDVMRQANALLVGDRWVWEDGQRVAGARVAVREIETIDEARAAERAGTPLFLPILIACRIGAFAGRAS